jgi:hypothetical protein
MVRDNEHVSWATKGDEATGTQCRLRDRDLLQHRDPMFHVERNLVSTRFVQCDDRRKMA